MKGISHTYIGIFQWMRGGCGEYRQGQRNGEPWSKLETKKPTNELELKAANYEILTFPKATIIHLQMHNIAALSYIAKMGSIHNKSFSDLAKEIWNYLLANGIMIIVEDLPGSVSSNVEEDHQAWSVTNSSKWKLNPVIFKKIFKVFRTPDIKLFFARTS